MGPFHLEPHSFQFFCWVLVSSLPLYIWGIFWPIHGLPFGLPATVVMIVLPAAVATLQVYRERGAAAAWQLWHRVGDVRRITSPWWFWIALSWMPVATVLAYALMRALGRPLPTAISVPFALTPVLFATYFIGAVFEEIGWTGYVTEPLQRRYGILGAGLVIGAVWALWHVVPWWLGQGHEPRWVLGEVALTLVLRVIMGWIYAKGGKSLFLAIVFHSMINTTFSLFPNGGTHYDPAVMAVVMAVLVGIVGPTRFRLCPDS
jgi:membrane protease YdiL (CAAX protease family)